MRIPILNCSKCTILPPAFIWIGNTYYANSEIWQPEKSEEKMRAGIGNCASAMNSFCFMFAKTIRSPVWGLQWLLSSEASPCRVPFTEQEAFCPVQQTELFYRDQLVSNGSPDCPTRGLTSQPTLSVKDVDRIPPLFALVICYADHS